MAEEKYTHPAWQSPGLEQKLSHPTEPFAHDKPAVTDFPQMLYKAGRSPITVHDKDARKECLDDGWQEAPIAVAQPGGEPVSVDE